VTKDAAQRSLSALFKAVSPSTLLRTGSLSNGLSNGSWTFYEAINIESLVFQAWSEIFGSAASDKLKTRSTKSEIRNKSEGSKFK
jgi:hypothetical protein